MRAHTMRAREACAESFLISFLKSSKPHALKPDSNESRDKSATFGRAPRET